MDQVFAGGTDVTMGIFVKAVEAQDCFPFVVCAYHGDVEGQPFITAAAPRWSTVMRIPASSIMIGSLFLDKGCSFSIALSPPSP
jgi:hypothetical protein